MFQNSLLSAYTILTSTMIIIVHGDMLQRVMKHIQSDGHPDLSNVHVPKTTNASIEKKNVTGKAVVKRVTKDKKAKGVGKAKKKHLMPLDVSNIILNKNIRTENELLALAQEQREQGKTELVAFILNRSPKTLADILTTTWQMKGAGEKISQLKKNSHRSPSRGLKLRLCYWLQWCLAAVHE